jgi:hypothetical protein
MKSLHSCLKQTLATIAALAVVLSSTGAPVVISSVEDWNGEGNPHEADGVVLSGSGTEADPATYTIPEGITLTASGVLRMQPSVAGSDLSVKLVFASGDLAIEPGGVINVGRLNRNGRQIAVFDLGGGNITGEGTILGILNPDDSPRVTTIENVTDVSLAAVDLHVVNANNSGRHFTIRADGAVNIGSIDNSDRDPGGNPSSDVVIRAARIEVGGVDTRALRSGGQAPNGRVVLEALAPPAFDPNAAFNNSFENALVLKGAIRTDGVGSNGGHVTLRGVRVLCLTEFSLAKAANGAFALEAGMLDNGVPAHDLFLNLSAATLTPSHVVQWAFSGVPGQPPAFNNDLIPLDAGEPDMPYFGTLAGTATDADNDPLTFLKGLGPAWLQIAPDGTLSGTPPDSGVQSWTIAVTDGTRYDTATLRIPVSGKPTFLTDPVLRPNGFQGQAYTSTLVGTAADPDNDPLTFAKVDGPAWLTVAANGALSGTPSSVDTFTNRWTVSVSDGTGSSTATLIIVVGGAPAFSSNPVIKTPARAGSDYGAAAVTLAGDAADPEGNPVAFAKVSGPAWLQIASEGALSGTPEATDVGPNSWTISASDGTFTSQATLRIEVRPGSAPVEITTTENWDGVQNPHASEGVTLSGSGTTGDPAVYTIPSGMIVRSTGLIRMNPAPGTAKSIQFVFASGDLQMDEGAVINVGQLDRQTRNNFVLDLGGGSITGQGRLLGLLNRDDSPRTTTIQNATDITMAEIDLHVVNANNSGRHLRITADGTVKIARVDNSDQDNRGNDSSDIRIQSSRIELGALDTRALRDDGLSRNGTVELQALAPPGFNPSGSENAFRNRVVLSGDLRTDGFGTIGGNVTIQGVVVQLLPGFILQKPEPANLVLQAGVVQGDAGAGDLFIDAAASGLTAEHVVQWSGDIEPALSITRNGGNVDIGWNGSGFILQENANMGNPDGWTDITDGTVNSASRPLAGGQKFYRVWK